MWPCLLFLFWRSIRIKSAHGEWRGQPMGVFREPEVVERNGQAGYDAVFLVMEHSGSDMRDIQMMVLVAERVGITPMVRAPGGAGRS